jgi:hypothetical protein
MIDDDEGIDTGRVDGERRFMDELGVTGSEVAGLLSAIMRKEFYKHRTSNTHKTVRRWNGSLLGISVSVTEVSVDGSLRYDYHVENVEWEFKVRMEPLQWSFSGSSVPHAIAKLGKEKIKLSYPNFDGDFEDYRHDMTMIRLMGLNNEDESDGVMLPPMDR